METDPTDPLVPELREAEQTLEAALEEACAEPPASEIDTGELIHVDELLGTASDAAKRAISLRRRRRANKSQRTERAAMGDVEAGASAEATHRVFADARGVRWDAFAVRPEALLAEFPQLRGPFSHGWLSFDSGTEKRRLSPIPEDWQRMSDEQLAQLLERAEVASRRRGRRRPHGGAGPEEPRQSE
ncbi:MAG: hypothetical protein M3282_08975 [Gemmatimonadota bacterium]|nr:hypothetical protein [Gemmatimonadota bacterium]